MTTTTKRSKDMLIESIGLCTRTHMHNMHVDADGWRIRFQLNVLLFYAHDVLTLTQTHIHIQTQASSVNAHLRFAVGFSLSVENGFDSEEKARNRMDGEQYRQQCNQTGRA